MASDISINELLEKAKREIVSGDSSMRAAAELIAAAHSKGATQRVIAEAAGKSVAWVNSMMKWRKGGYRDETPFGAKSKEARQRRARVQATKNGSINAELDVTFWREAAEQARTEAEQARYEAQKARAEAERARRQAAQAKARVGFDANPKQAFIAEKDRSLIVKALGMLSSSFDGERANAVSLVEKQRQRLGFVWDDLFISATQSVADAA